MFSQSRLLFIVLTLCLTLWLCVSHLYMRIHYVYDEVLLDALILADIAVRCRRRGYATYAKDASGYMLDLMTVWLCILYWILWSYAPAIDAIENVWVMMALLVRIQYATRMACSTRVHHAPHIQFQKLPPGVVEDQVVEEVQAKDLECDDGS